MPGVARPRQPEERRLHIHDLNPHHTSVALGGSNGDNLLSSVRQGGAVCHCESNALSAPCRGLHGILRRQLLQNHASRRPRVDRQSASISRLANQMQQLAVSRRPPPGPSLKGTATVSPSLTAETTEDHNDSATVSRPPTCTTPGDHCPCSSLQAVRVPPKGVLTVGSHAGPSPSVFFNLAATTSRPLHGEARFGFRLLGVHRLIEMSPLVGSPFTRHRESLFHHRPKHAWNTQERSSSKLARLQVAGQTAFVPGA